MTASEELRDNGVTVFMKANLWSQEFRIEDIDQKIKFHQWMSAMPKPSPMSSELVRDLKRIKKIALDLESETT